MVYRGSKQKPLNKIKGANKGKVRKVKGYVKSKKNYRYNSKRGVRN